MLPVAIVTFLWGHGTAMACDGHPPGTPCANGGQEEVALTEPGRAKGAQPAVAPGNCARQGELVGLENCAWTTSLMAQRVLADGAPYTYVGGLVPSTRVLPSKVAAPYTVGPASGPSTLFVIANEVLDTFDPNASRVQLTGKVLEVEGIVYFVATGVVPLDS
jgi:hypothetical protein